MNSEGWFNKKSIDKSKFEYHPEKEIDKIISDVSSLISANELEAAKYLYRELQQRLILVETDRRVSDDSFTQLVSRYKEIGEILHL